MKRATIPLIVLLLTLVSLGLATADSTSRPAVHPEMEESRPATEIISPTLRLLTTLPQPSSWGEHALAYNPQQDVAMLYGGNRSGHPYNSDSWQWHDADWQQLTPAHQPVARYGMATGYLSDGQLILFGGSDQNDTALNQTWTYTNGDWLNLEPAFRPAARTYPAVATADDGLYLFGGNDGTVYHQDLWRYTDGTWSCLLCAPSENSPQLPAARTLSAMAIDPLNQQMLLFGGQDETGNALADLWLFDLHQQSWQEVTPSTGPTGRWAHSLTYDKGNEAFWLIGGTPDDETILGESWLYQDGRWQLAASEPTVAYHQTVALNNQTLMVVGQGQSWFYQINASPDLLTNNGFESGDFGSWIQDIEGLSIDPSAAHDGQYGVKLNGSGRMYYSLGAVCVSRWWIFPRGRNWPGAII